MRVVVILAWHVLHPRIRLRNNVVTLIVVVIGGLPLKLQTPLGTMVLSYNNSLLTTRAYLTHAFLMVVSLATGLVLRIVKAVPVGSEHAQ
jgi:hypothetical protein